MLCVYIYIYIYTFREIEREMYIVLPQNKGTPPESQPPEVLGWGGLGGEAGREAGSR